MVRSLTPNPEPAYMPHISSIYRKEDACAYPEKGWGAKTSGMLVVSIKRKNQRFCYALGTYWDISS